MIYQIKKILGFKRCMRCHESRLKLYPGLFNRGIRLCESCRDDVYEYEMSVQHDDNNDDKN